MNAKKSIPVILDTDIGSDIDDTWALAMILKCPELDVKLVAADNGDTEYRSKIIAKMLEVAGRADIPVGIGIRKEDDYKPQLKWVEDYSLDSYPGTVCRDGVDAIIKTIEKTPGTISLICIGPMPNIAEALRRAPHIAKKTRFVAMQGSMHKDSDGKAGPVAECNIVCAIKAAQEVYKGSWIDMTITPLDTCGIVRLRGEKYAAITQCRDPLVQAVIENYRIWLKGKPDSESSILYDTVGIHLAYSTEFLKMKKMRLKVTDEGFTVPDEKGVPVNVAIEWTNLDGFENELVRRLVGTKK